MALYTLIPPVESSGSVAAQDQVGTNDATVASGKSTFQAPGGEYPNRSSFYQCQSAYTSQNNDSETYSGWILSTRTQFSIFRHEQAANNDIVEAYVVGSTLTIEPTLDGATGPRQNFEVGDVLADGFWHHFYLQLINRSQLRLVLDNGALLDETRSMNFNGLAQAPNSITLMFGANFSTVFSAGYRAYGGVVNESQRDFRRAMPVGDTVGTVTGVPRTYETLTYNPPNYSDGSSFVGYQWYRENADADYLGDPIAGATSATYDVQPADEGFYLYCREIRSNFTFDGRSATWTGFFPSEYTEQITAGAYTLVPPVESSGGTNVFVTDQIGTNDCNADGGTPSATGPGGEYPNRVETRYWRRAASGGAFQASSSDKEEFSWWQSQTGSRSNNGLLYWIDDDTSDAIWFHDEGNDLKFDVRPGNVSDVLFTYPGLGATLADDLWHHFSVQLDRLAGTIRLVIDNGDLLDVTESHALWDLKPPNLQVQISGGTSNSVAGFRAYGGVLGNHWRDFRRAMPVGDSTGTVTGTADIGQTLTYNPPTYSDGSVFVGYQWYRDTGSDYQGQLILGATSATYTVQGADVAHKLYCREIRSNSAFDGRSATWTGFWPSEYTEQVPGVPAELPRMYAEATAQFSPSAAVSGWSFLVNLANLPQEWWDDVTSPDGSRGRASLDEDTQLPVHFIDFDSGAQTGWARVFYNPAFSTPRTIRIHPPRSDISSEGPNDLRGQYNAYDSDWYAYYPAGATPTDATRNGFDMTTTGTVSVIDGKVAAGYSNANGGNNFAQITSGVSLNNQAITQMGWIRPNAGLSANGDPYGSYVGTGASDRLIPLARFAANDWRIQHRVGANNTNIDLAGRGSGSWVHIAQSYGGSPLNQGFRAGVQEGTAAGTRADTTWDALRLLARTSNGQNFYGDVSDVQFHSTTRSEAWINYEWRQSDNNAAFWGVWTYEPGGAPVDLAVAWNANATMSADLDVVAPPIDLATAWDATAVLTADIDVTSPLPTDLATAWDATAILTADIDVTTPLPTDLAVVWDATATLTADIDITTPLPTDLAVAWDAIATLTADIDIEAPGFEDLATVWDATAALTADLDVTTPLPTDLAVDWDATAILIANIDVEVPGFEDLDVIWVATAQLDATMSAARTLAVTWDATADLTANLDVEVPGFEDLDAIWSATAALTAELDVVTPLPIDLATVWQAEATASFSLSVAFGLEVAWDATAILVANIDVESPGFENLDVIWTATADLVADLDLIAPGFEDLAAAWDAVATATFDLEVVAAPPIDLDVAWDATADLTADLDIQLPGAIELDVDWTSVALADMAVSIARGLAVDWDAVADDSMALAVVRSLAVDWDASATMVADLDVELPLTVDLAVDWLATAEMSAAPLVDFSLAVEWQATAVDSFALRLDFVLAADWQAVALMDADILVAPLDIGPTYHGICLPQRPLCALGAELPSDERRLHLPTIGDVAHELPWKEEACVGVPQRCPQSVELPNADRRLHLQSLSDPGIEIPRKEDVDCMR